MSRVRELPRFSVPGHCIMYPGRRRDERGFYLFDTVLEGAKGDIHVGISGEGLRNIATKHGAQFGIALREDLVAETARANESDAKVAGLEDRIAELEAFKSALSGVAAEGFIIKKRTGRPATKEGSNGITD